MRIDLPSGHYAELRDVGALTARDDRVAKAAFEIRIREDGTREITMDYADKVKYALLKELITAWDLPSLPIPRDAVDGDAVLESLSRLDIKKLLEAVTPAYDEIMETEKDPKAKKASAS